MNVTCYTDAVVRAHLDRAVAGHVTADVCVVIAAKQEAPSLGGVIQRARRCADTILCVVGASTDGTADVARSHGAEVLMDGGRGKGEALRRAIPHIRTPITVFLDADGSHDPEDIPMLVGPIVAGDADHVTASRLRGGSSELHGGFDEFLRLAGSSFITACINWRFGCRLSDSHNGFRAVRTAVLRDLDLREDGTQILDQCFEIITAILGPFAAAMTAKIEADHAPPRLPERVGDPAPHSARLPCTVKQEHGRVIVRTDSLGFEPHASETTILNDAHAHPFSTETPAWSHASNCSERRRIISRAMSGSPSIIAWQRLRCMTRVRSRRPASA